MRTDRLQITYKFIFTIMLAVLLASRILLLSELYTWSVNPVHLELLYLAAAAFMCLTYRKGTLKFRPGLYLLVPALVLIHTLLWGKVFVDSQMADVINSHFQSQFLFVVVIVVTVFTIQQLNADTAFIECGYYVLSAILLMQFILNLSDLDLSNLANILTVDQRTRTDFGFGHFNTLGAACACNILLWEVVRKHHRTLPVKTVDLAILIYTVCMLLCSASRSALTSVALYYLVYYSQNMKDWPVSSRTLFLIKVLRILLIIAMAAWVLLDFDYTSFLEVAQRGHLVTLVLPMFFGSGQLWLGLGFASNVAYAEGYTPYLTRWLDNAYVYYMVTTGFIGMGIMIVALVIMIIAVRRKVNTPFGRETFAAVLVYAYVSFFEVVMFNSGVLANYLYLPWFLLHASKISGQQDQGL